MTAHLLIEANRLGPLEQLGKGGTAVVYRVDSPIPGFTEVAYKEYKQVTRAHAGPSLLPGLLALVRFREDLADRHRRRWDERIVWPLRVVVNEHGAATGVLMPLIENRFFHLFSRRAGAPCLKPREVETLFGSAEDMGKVGLPRFDIATRSAVVAEIATTYAMMHRADVVVGDISGRNITYDTHGGRPMALVVDADSTRVRGTRSVFSSQPHTPHWEPPESLLAAREFRRAVAAGDPRAAQFSSRITMQNKATDVYKFGLMVARVLDPGRGSPVNRDPRTAARVLHRVFGPGAAELLFRSVADDPEGRPTMRDWHDITHPGAEPRPIVPATGPPPQQAAERRTTSAPRQPDPAAVPDGHVQGSWVFVSGTGWLRRPAGN
ncbi:hypothetical protein AB0M43_35550 [Longispora sp. NPDC051575]|uniref:hypothetical protein n=1 Tax=Longispora sp. NPDC051575 TaxID=3154943 RepID=UPI00343F4CC0